MFGNKLGKVSRAVEKGKSSVLIGLLHDRDTEVRVAAIEGLGKLKSTDAVNPLVNLLHDTVPEVRKAAALGLAEIGDGHSKAHITFAAERESDPGVKEALLQAAGKLKNY